MRLLLVTLAIGIFGLGCCVGGAVERRCLQAADDGMVLTYQGAVYVRAVEGMTLESYLTAAGKGKRP